MDSLSVYYVHVLYTVDVLNVDGTYFRSPLRPNQIVGINIHATSKSEIFHNKKNSQKPRKIHDICL